MKKQTLILASLILFGLSLLTIVSCKGTDKKPANAPAEQVKEQYQCPMKCTEEKFDKPGKCPVCEMELEKVVNS